MAVRSALALACAAAALAAAPAPPQTFRAGVRTVPVYTTVSDAGGRLVPDLSRDDFRIFDNGREVEVTVFSNDIQPITVALMLDMSGSMQGRLLLVREAALHFTRSLLPHDRVRIGTFGSEIAVSPHLTNDPPLLERILREELWPGGGTPLWPAVDAAMTSLANESGRRVVLALTDGAANQPPGFGPLADETGVARRAVSDDFMIYAVGIEGSGLEGGIVELSERTGGGHFVVPQGADLRATFARIADELRHQYLLGFSPATLDNRLHRLDVRLTRSGLRARARRQYLAARDR